VSPPAGAVGAGRIIGSSPALRRVLAVVARVAPSDASVLITGETGTGKELIAQAIHERSARRHRPLVSLNCPAIPSTLAESELFGHERGAFTDAVAARPGRFEQADGGTLFLDEIGDLSLAVQAKLLRTLQERETQRIGAAGTRRVDVRVIAATNRDLRAASRHGRFREDLYFRLAAVEIALPPLRDRPGDVAMLAAAFLQRAATQYRRAVGGVSAEAMQLLANYAWPGNVRELQHAVGQAVLLCDGEVICPEHLPRLREAECGPTLRMAIREDKRRYISDALAQNDGNQAAAARALGMSRANLARAMKSLGIAAPRAPSEEAGV
jgi:two-component system response regulator HydG